MTPAPPTDLAAARVLLVQWSGDYREAYHRLAAGGPETYHAQRESVETAGEFAKMYGLYGVLCMTASTAYDEVMPNGVRAIGVALDPRHLNITTLVRAVEAVDPTHLVVTTPQPDLFSWARRRGVHLLPALADTFHAGTAGMSWPRRLIRTWRHVRYCRRLAKLLNDPRVRWVGNHNVSASRDLVRIGVNPRKIVPCDFPPQVRPEQHEPKSLDPTKTPWELLYVGSVMSSKGVGDAVLAAAELRRRGRTVRLRVMGRGDTDEFRLLAKDAVAAGAIVFDGPKPHDEVVAAMRAADLVLVPSRHEYPEGLPLTIYEALAVRTPLVCSDHPAFRDRVAGDAAVCVSERSPAALADAAERILTDPALYRRMSDATAATWSRLVCPVTYEELIRRWVRQTPDDERWLAAHSLASGRYG